MPCISMMLKSCLCALVRKNSPQRPHQRAFGHHHTLGIHPHPGVVVQCRCLGFLNGSTSGAVGSNTQTHLAYLVANFRKFGHQLACKYAELEFLSRHRLCRREHVITILGRIPERATLIGMEQIYQHEQLTMTKQYKHAGAGRRSSRNS